MNFLRKFRDFIASPSHSRTMGILMVFVLAAVISLTVIASQERQTTKQRAANPANSCDNISSIPDCSTLNATPDLGCASEGLGCKIGNTIYECQKQ